jgi:hypothetical protein
LYLTVSVSAVVHYGVLLLLQVGGSAEFVESDGEVVQVCCIDGHPRNVFEKWDDATWRLKQALNRVMRGQQAQPQAGG